MRAWNFACELAARGHQVILICESHETEQPAPDVASVRRLIRTHDWRGPLIVAVNPRSTAMLDRVRSPRTWALVRKGIVAWSYLRHSGMFNDFSQGAGPYLVSIGEVFRPQVVWGVFGNTDCWLVARRLARLSGCAWVADMKDSWDLALPFGLRTLVARRFRSMTASTANARFSAEVLERWFPTRPEVIYSGVSEYWIQPSPRPVDGFTVMLVGSTYGEWNLTRFVDALGQWVQSLPVHERARVALCYAGSDAEKVRSAVTGLASLIRVDVRSYVVTTDLADLCRAAAVNAYLWFPETFHHKVIELLCCRRPIVSFPGERAESLELARQVGGSLNVCGDWRRLHEVLSSIWDGELVPTSEINQMQPLTWSRRADLLEAVLRRAAAGDRAGAH